MQQDSISGTLNIQSLTQKNTSTDTAVKQPLTLNDCQSKDRVSKFVSNNNLGPKDAERFMELCKEWKDNDLQNGAAIGAGLGTLPILCSHGIDSIDPHRDQNTVLRVVGVPMAILSVGVGYQIGAHKGAYNPWGLPPATLDNPKELPSIELPGSQLNVSNTSLALIYGLSAACLVNITAGTFAVCTGRMVESLDRSSYSYILNQATPRLESCMGTIGDYYIKCLSCLQYPLLTREVAADVTNNTDVSSSEEQSTVIEMNDLGTMHSEESHTVLV